MTKALNKQLNKEFYSAFLYLSMSAYSNRNDFNGAANWFLLQYQEEQDHATRIYNYMIDQDAKVVLQEIGKPPKNFGSLLNTYEESLLHEQSMTQGLNELSDYALKEKDHATYNLLQWFVNEQVEEESNVNDIISKLKMVGDDGYGLLMIDSELGKRAAISASTAV